MLLVLQSEQLEKLPTWQLKGNTMKTKALALLASVGAIGSANAAVDTTAIQTAVLADVATVSAYGFAILTAVLGASIGIKLVKKFTNKAS